MSEPRTPQTEAGKRLLQAAQEHWDYTTGFAAHLIAIEREAVAVREAELLALIKAEPHEHLDYDPACIPAVRLDRLVALLTPSEGRP